ncbi:hypothetical protein GCM10020331_067370 [Ectobacillus funiculus]
MQPFKHAAAIIEKLEKHGFEAYFVGGSVRDFIIGKPISDVDIATSALPNEVMRIFSSSCSNWAGTWNCACFV